MKIVVADDDSSQRTYLSAILRVSGHEVLTAENGTEALDLLSNSDAAMLICDVEMPGIDGLSLASRVRSAGFGRYVYVLIITGATASSGLMGGLKAGADDFMTKPVDRDLLELRVSAAERYVAHESELQASHSRLATTHAMLQDDLRAAAIAQSQLLPDPLVVKERTRFTSKMMASSFVSGDVFGYFDAKPAGVGFYAADISGHGVKAALTAAALARLVSADDFQCLPAHDEYQDPRPACMARLASNLDQRFGREVDDASYLTLFAGLLSEENDRLVFCQAGYPSPLMLRADGRTEWIGDGGLPVGLVPGASFENQTVHFGPEDRMLVYSDGIIEAEDPDGTPFGEERLSDFLTLNAALPAGAIVEKLANRLHDFTRQHEVADDITLIMIEREPNHDLHA